jgi:integrase
MGDPQDKATGHGFRATASTILNRRRSDRDVIEAALAHQDQNEIRRIYNRSPERTQLMQDCADLLDSFKGRKPARRAA